MHPSESLPSARFASLASLTRRMPGSRAGKWALAGGCYLAFSVWFSACQKTPEADAGPGESRTITPRQMADALHLVMESDRTVYTQKVVNRLQNEEKVIQATEHWQDEKTLPLPAQMFRMGSEKVTEKGAGWAYSLQSLWPVNRQNAPKTEAETAGLRFVADNPGKNYYTEETLGGKKYFTAIYPDRAVAQACITCHNDHKDSPRHDFKLGDVMGGVVVRLPLDEK